MRIISRRRMREFWQSRSGDQATAEKYLRIWEKICKSCHWTDWADLKRTFGVAVDKVGHCFVFNVARNRFRLIALIN